MSISDELFNNIVTFVDVYGETFGTFDFFEKIPYFFGNITYDKEIKLITKPQSSKYNNLLDINGEYYYGNYNNNNNTHIFGKIYKIIVPNNDIVNSKNEYILLIIHNPNYDPNSENILVKGKYKLIIYNIVRRGTYVRKLVEMSNYTSLI